MATKKAQPVRKLWALNDGGGTIYIYRSLQKPTVQHPKDWWGNTMSNRWEAVGRKSAHAMCTAGFKRTTGISIPPGKIREVKVTVK